MEKSKILIIDDDPLFCQTTEQQINSLGFETAIATSGSEGDRLAREEDFALILLDLRLNAISGLSLLKNWIEDNLNFNVAMISGQGTIPEAVEALKIGALDFLVKPVDINILEAVIKRSLSLQQLQRENLRLRQLAEPEKVAFIGETKIIKSLLEDARKVAQSDHPVLLEGETGTGKQVLALYIYSNSPQANEPFVRLNCAAISPTLFESELFGHEKGAFTGAYTRKIGKLELVGKGTLFLDEIGELPPACQAKILTAVEDRTFERVGGNKTLHFAGRIIAATNRNLENEVNVGNFRKDLFYRLNTFRLRLPALRNHPDDIPLYIENALHQCGRKIGLQFHLPDETIIKQLSQYPWPGNVRELIHHIERITLFARSPTIPRSLWLSQISSSPESVSETESNLELSLSSFKMKHILQVLSDCGGNQTLAAKRLGIGRTYLNRLLSSYKKNQ
jgi:DNA-binding NtrC family response regulator